MLKRIASVLLVASLPLSALACGGSVSSEPVASAQAAATKAPVAVNAHGQVKLMGAALGEVALRPDQRTQIEKLATDADARHAPVLAARKDLGLALAAQVEAGAIDRAALQPKIDAVTNAMSAARDADRAALEQLHGILDADQRVAFVDAMKAKGKAFHEGHERGGDHGKTARAGGPDHGFGGHWAADLKLTDDQKSQLHDAMKARWQAMKGANPGAGAADHAGPGDHDKRMHHDGAKVLEAFKGDRFVMDEVAPKKDIKAEAGKMSDRMIGFVETALPILTPEQRTIAAQKIREHANEEGTK